MRYLVPILLGAIGGVAAIAILNRTTFGKTILNS
jgi:hypothetical protein